MIDLSLFDTSGEAKHAIGKLKANQNKTQSLLHTNTINR
jgi:hypothetical protein